jgi:hypothetical protein
MLLEDDFYRFEDGPMAGRNVPATAWPPLEYIDIARSAEVYALESFSQLTDEESASMSHVCRGALYKLYIPPATATGVVESLIHVQEAEDV